MEPAYERLAAELRGAILGNEYELGDQLPSEKALSERHNVSRQTVRHVFHLLRAEGLIRTEKGRGTFVEGRDRQFISQSGSIANLLALSPEATTEILDRPHVVNDPLAADRLGAESDPVVAMTTVRHIADGPLCVFFTFFPLDLKPAATAWVDAFLGEGVDHPTNSLVPFLDGYLSHPIALAEQTITARPADSQVAGHLKIGQGDPILKIDRTYLTADQRPVMFTSSYFSSQLYSYRVTLRRDVE